MKYKASDIAARLGAAVEGDGTVELTGVAGVREALPGEITFVAQPRYAPDVAVTRASVVIVGRDWNKPCPAPALIRAENPEKAFEAVAMIFAPPPVVPVAGIHRSAIVAPDVRMGEQVSIGPYCVIEPGVKLGHRVVISAGCYVGHGVAIGDDTKLYPHVTVREYVQIGSRVIVHNGTVLGSDGFGYAVDGKGIRTKIPQIGIVVIGDDVEIGANVTVDRARFGKTRIGNGVKIDNLVQVAHNVTIGDHAVLVAQVGVAGSSQVGEHAILAGQAGVSGHLTVGAWAVVGAQAGVTKDVPPKTFVSGYPAAPHDKAARLHAHINRLPELKEKVAGIDKRLKQLEEKQK